MLSIMHAAQCGGGVVGIASRAPPTGVVCLLLCSWRVNVGSNLSHAHPNVYEGVNARRECDCSVAAPAAAAASVSDVSVALLQRCAPR